MLLCNFGQFCHVFQVISVCSNCSWSAIRNINEKNVHQNWSSLKFFDWISFCHLYSCATSQCPNRRIKYILSAKNFFTVRVVPYWPRGKRKPSCAKKGRPYCAIWGLLFCFSMDYFSSTLPFFLIPHADRSATQDKRVAERKAVRGGWGSEGRVGERGGWGSPAK